MSSEPSLVNHLRLPDPAEMSINDLRSMFLIASEEFSRRLEGCKDVDELRDLQAYIKVVSQQLHTRGDV